MVPEDLFKVCADGLILCKLINKAQPGVIFEKAINLKIKTVHHKVGSHVVVCGVRGVCMCVCMCARASFSKRPSISRLKRYVTRYVYIYIHIHTHLYMYLCIYIHIYLYIHTCTYINIYMYMYLHIHIYVHAYMYMYRYLHI